ncbi:hypothetical protein PE36_03094 [Moritella sp. PE36]|nr:hypothetical protein PE36_03094 [Moritella sp. PE36]
MVLFVVTTLKGKPTGIEFIDYTSIKVYHNLRRLRHKIDKVKGLSNEDKNPNVLKALGFLQLIMISQSIIFA